MWQLSGWLAEDYGGWKAHRLRDLRQSGYGWSEDVNTNGTLERLLTVGEVADLLQVPASWVYGHTRRRSIDRIPGFRLGKYWRFREADVLVWLERQQGRS